jgi:3-methyl-2-oxobutanoate hydroxymethyltransferase
MSGDSEWSLEMGEIRMSMSASAGASVPTSPRATESGVPTLYGATATGRRVTTRDLIAAKSRGEKWPMITAYDALTARIFDEAGIPVMLVGDSAAMVVYGYDSTVPVCVDDLIPLAAAVVRGSSRALVVGDLPFGSYQASPQQAVKLEGGARVLPQVEALVGAGIPVMAHLGLTPQSVNQLGGYRVQGRGEDGEILMQDAKAMEAAGAFAIVLEVVPSDLGERVTRSVSIPTIGIGAGASTDAQVLVWQDMAGLSPRVPKFVKRYADVRTVLSDAVHEWADEVVAGTYPGPEHQYR